MKVSDRQVENNGFPKCLLKRFSTSNSSSDSTSSSSRHTDASCLHVIEIKIQNIASCRTVPK